MKKKIAVMIMTLGLLTQANSIVSNAESYCKKVIDVPKYGTYVIHGLYSKTTSSDYVRVVNYSGHGEYGYAICKIRCCFNGTWVNYSDSTSGDKVYKNDSNTVIRLADKVNANTRVSFRFTGAKTQNCYDENSIKVKY